MGIISISEMIYIIKKHFVRVLAFSVAGALLVMAFFTYIQTYTCKLDLKYAHSQAEEGLAPDGTSTLNPYEIQNPTVIQGAINALGLNDDKTISVEGIRNHITITEIVPSLEQEVSESAALLGEKYEVFPTEYEVSYTYKANLGDEFGARLFDSIIKEYDEFLLKKYYNKREIADFAKILTESSADYIEIADSMSEKIDSIIEYLDSLAESYPEYRSQRTGYTFSELSNLYHNLRDIQYAKYYGNVRAGNLSKDNEMVVKRYQAKVKDLTAELNVDQEMAEHYKKEITSFYDSYKETGLYNQANQIQNSTDSSNNRDQEIYENYDTEEIVNTYDSIILNYADKAEAASDKQRTIENYNVIIQSFANDQVDAATKERLLAKNQEIFDEIKILSAEYSEIANEAVDEYFSSEVGTDLKYLITSDVTEDKPVNLITAFAFVLLMAFGVFGVLIFELYKKFDKSSMEQQSEATEEEVDFSKMDEFQRLAYEQCAKGFPEFYLVYQPMLGSNTDEITNYETFVRWENEEVGMVSPVKTIQYLRELGKLEEFNSWILETVCKMIQSCIDKKENVPVIHVNCPNSEVEDFGIHKLVAKYVKKYKIPAEYVCLEIDGSDIAAGMDDIVLLKDMGIQICIDRFESKDDENEIIELVEPDYVKMSSDIINSDIYATTDEEILKATQKMLKYFTRIIVKCAKKNIKVCVCGIENAEQDQMVSDLGFDFKQGYYYAKPKETLK